MSKGQGIYYVKQNFRSYKINEIFTSINGLMCVQYIMLYSTANKNLPIHTKKKSGNTSLDKKKHALIRCSWLFNHQD
jgi:hypothetical protein